MTLLNWIAFYQTEHDPVILYMEKIILETQTINSSIKLFKKMKFRLCQNVLANHCQLYHFHTNPRKNHNNVSVNSNLLRW